MVALGVDHHDAVGVIDVQGTLVGESEVDLHPQAPPHVLELAPEEAARHAGEIDGHAELPERLLVPEGDPRAYATWLVQDAFRAFIETDQTFHMTADMQLTINKVLVDMDVAEDISGGNEKLAKIAMQNLFIFANINAGHRLTLPPGLPLWMALLGGAFAIAVLLGYLLQRLISGPLLRLTDITREVTRDEAAAEQRVARAEHHGARLGADGDHEA